MNRVNRLLALFLALCILVGLCPILPAGAALTTEQQSTSDVPEAKSDTVSDGSATEQRISKLLERIRELTPSGEWNGLVDLTKKDLTIEGLRGQYLLRITFNGTNYVLDGSGNIATQDGRKYLQALTGFTMGPNDLYLIPPEGTVGSGHAVNLVPLKNLNSAHASYIILFADGKALTFGDVYSNTTKTNVASVPATLKEAEKTTWFFHNPGSSYGVIHRSVPGAPTREHLLEFESGTSRIWWSSYFPKTNSNYTQSPNASHSIYFYRLWSTDALKAAIDTVINGGYLDSPHSYPEGIYADFLTCLEECVSLYEQYNQLVTEPMNYGEYPAEVLDRQRTALLSYTTLLGSGEEYIDIPVEILDFRADGILFQNMTYYHLRYGGQDYKNAVAGAEGYTKYDESEIAEAQRTAPDLPGTVINQGSGNIDVKSNTARRTGLTKQTLDENGRLLYEEQTIAYVAHLLNSPQQTINGEYKNAFSGNTAFYNITQRDTYKLGTWADTLNKIGYNGGTLLYEDIETAFDLAYYCLTYLWYPVPHAEGNRFEDGYCYNMLVPERSTFRMYRSSETGLYTLDAKQSMGYADRWVLNAPLIQAKKSQPHFAPIDALGFEQYDPESDNLDTGTAGGTMRIKGVDTDDSNYLFTVHAYGSFVYYEEQEQQFTFVGDDDVYFFVNGKMALDVGGGHLALGDTVKLNDLADTLGLREGEICTFDMFYAERATDDANLKFSTNIKISDAATLTTKGQYAVQLDGNSSVDPATGKGGAMADNATVRVGDIIAYSFDLTNIRDIPVMNLEFRDATLGVSLTKDRIETYYVTTEDGVREVSLTDPAYSNGVITRYSDLILEYCTLDRTGKPLSDEVRDFTAGEMLSILADTKPLLDNRLYYRFEPLEEGVYRVRVTSEEELCALLKAGIPMQCSLSIYGFLRKTAQSDLPYENLLTTCCYYPESEAVDAPLISVDGYASRLIRVLEHSSMPQVRRLDVVLDYGKAVEIPLEDIEDLIRFEDGSPVKIGSVIGFLRKGYNGELLKKRPDNLFCSESGSEEPATQGTYRLIGDNLVYEPNQFLTQIDTIYGVVGVEGFYYGETTTEEFRYILVEIRLTPAHVMYYETDFAPDIFTLTQAGSFEDVYEREKDVYKEWSRIEDQSGSADPFQDYERLNGTVYHTDIDPEYIPAEAFFVDFDGEGYERRYRDNPQYGGYDFDQRSQWLGSKDATTSVSTDPLTGTMTVAFDGSKNNAYRYAQTIITGATTFDGTQPLKLYPGKDHYMQIRFRVENCIMGPWANYATFGLYFSDPNKSDVYNDSNHALIIQLDEEELLSGKYLTLKASLSGLDTYTGADIIDAIRFQVFNIKEKSNQTGKIIVDYIYIGPEKGMEDDIYGNYLFVGFDNTPEVPLRYSSSIYGTDSRFNTAYRPLDTAGAWASSSAGTTIQIKKGLEGDANNGYIYFEDKLDDSKLDPKATKHYSYIHAGTIATGNGIYNYPINYTPTRNDFCQIRIKIENGGIVPDQVLGLGIEYSKGNICGKANLDTSYLDGNFHTITFPLDAPYWKKHWIEKKEKLNWLHPVVYNLQAKNGATTGAKITIDYIFIGPEHMLDRVSQHVKPGAEQVNHLFFDFNNNDVAKVRYTYPIYGVNSVNYADSNTWTTESCTKTASGGAIVLTDSGTDRLVSLTAGTNYSLAFDPGETDFLRLRMKVAKNSGANAENETMTIALKGDGDTVYGTTDYSFSTYADGTYRIFTIPLDPTACNGEELLTKAQVSITGTQKCTFTIDYIYVGPLTKSNPSAPSLYFGFGDRGSGHWNTDSIRYNSDTYGFLNYDTNRWLSESEAVRSSLTQNIFGWKYAGNEDRGKPVDAAIKDYVPPFPPVENVSYPKLAVSPKPDTGNLEVVVDIDAGKTADTVAIQTYPSISSPRYYWRHFMQTLNYHPAEENIVQIRFRTEGLTIQDNFTVKLMYLPTGANAFCTSAPLKLAPQMPLNPEENYVIMTAQLDDTFDNAPAIERLRLVFEGLTAEKGDKILIDYVYAGVGRLAPEPVYGYDSSYLNDTELSNGSSFVVTGRGVKTQFQTDKYTEASFSFRGTGFDIISRTDMNQGAIRVEVWKKGADKTKDKAVKTLTVNNKGELELFQIPVVSVQGLPYGEYDVTLWVNAPIKTPYEFLNHKGNFHFDAVRIYDPMGEDTGLTSEVLFTYLVDTEGYASVKEVRNILLSAENFASQLTGSGAIFVDSAEEPTVTVPATDASGNPIPSSTTTIVPEGIVVNGHTTASVTTYDKIGPKNEVYLAPGQAVAFMLKISTEYVPTSVDVGVKTIKANEPANLVAGIVTKGNATVNGLMQIDGRRDVTIRSATAQYYALPIDANTFFTAEDGNRYCYIVLYNNGTAGTVTNVLSVTDLKVAYDKEPEIGLPQDAITDKEIQKRSGKAEETYYDFVVDSHTLEAAALVMKTVLETPLLAEGTKLMHSLNLASDISINYAVTKESMADYDSFYLGVHIPGREEVLRIDPVEKGMHYYFTLEGLTAVQMADVLEATLYMEKDGRFYYSETDRYSIAQYAYSQLRKTDVSRNLKALCADLLVYGASAQVYKGYRTDSLADSDMTEEEKAYGTDLNTVTFGNTNKVLNDLPDAPIAWAGKTLNLESKVALKFVFNPTGYSGAVKDLTLRVSYEDIDGNTKTVSAAAPELYNEAMGLYVFTVDSLLAAELRTVVSVQIYAGDTPVSCTLQYSADTYGNNKAGTLLTLCKAIFAYSDSAKAYFG